MKTTDKNNDSFSVDTTAISENENIPFQPHMHGKVTCLDSKEDEILALPLDDISQPSDLNISTSPLKENLNTDADILGRRIVNISHLFNAIKLIDSHKPFDCSFKDMRIIKEIKYGFKSTFVFKCDMCNTIRKRKYAVL
uniref:Mutator-like transposase domain-containing protein n=1 Tax=Sipha flava TaxID=143950 RepID=A0A2S2Q659_9HEMI